MSSPLYLDSSALVKLVIPEPETEALVDLLSGWPDRISSALARVEVLRAARRVGKAACGRAENVVSRIGLVRVDGEVLDAAARLEPSELRSLDAVRLATALSVGDSLDCMVSYDARFMRAAGRNGIPALSPGAEDGR